MFCELASSNTFRATTTYVGTEAGVIKIREISNNSDTDSRKLHVLCII